MLHNFLQQIFQLNEKGYWLLLIYLFAAGVVVYKLPKRTMLVSGRYEQRWYWVSVLLLAGPYILWGGYRGIIGDTGTYIQIFRSAPSSFAQLSAVLTPDSKDPGFTVLMALIKIAGITNYRTFLLVITMLQILCLCYTFRKYSPNFWISFFLFIASTDYISWTFNGLRQFIAVCILFAAFDLLVRKKYVLYVLIVLLVAQIHGSAVLMLPLAYVMHGPALNRKTVVMIIGTALVIPFIDRLLPIMNDLLSDTQYSTTMNDEIWAADDGTNPIRVLVYSVPALIALFGHRYFRRIDDPVMNLCINASMITMAMYLVSAVTSGIYRWLFLRLPKNNKEYILLNGMYSLLFGYNKSISN